ncbi:hypothetical protein PMIN05_001300 [Paraphaeosphaeria minitans]
MATLKRAIYNKDLAISTKTLTRPVQHQISKGRSAESVSPVPISYDSLRDENSPPAFCGTIQWSLLVEESGTLKGFMARLGVFIGIQRILLPGYLYVRPSNSEIACIYNLKFLDT